MVHGMRLDGGKAEWYRNRFVQTTKLRKGLEATDPEAMFDPTASAANTHVLATPAASGRSRRATCRTS
jgi:carotenoid cleavage dioxygenase-like enzyme